VSRSGRSPAAKQVVGNGVDHAAQKRGDRDADESIDEDAERERLAAGLQRSEVDAVEQGVEEVDA